MCGVERVGKRALFPSLILAFASHNLHGSRIVCIHTLPPLSLLQLPILISPHPPIPSSRRAHTPGEGGGKFSILSEPMSSDRARLMGIHPYALAHSSLVLLFLRPRSVHRNWLVLCTPLPICSSDLTRNRPYFRHTLSLSLPQACIRP